MAAIEVITSSKRPVHTADEYTGEIKTVYVPVWNPTVANLTLMALGSSAPEIFLSTLGTVFTLGEKPDPMGAAAIVGSAAFNFLVISGISILCVHEGNDERTEKQIKEDGTVKGVKKIYDMNVFAICATWSVVAYLWLFYVLSDSQVTTTEGFVTLGFFFLLLGMAYTADCMRAKTIKQQEEDIYGNFDMQQMKVTDFYEKLIPIEQGKEPADQDKEQCQQMRQFLLKQFGTTNISGVDKEALKQRLTGDHMIERIGYRKKVALNGHKEAIEKGAIIRTQNKMASEASDHNPRFGFSCLHYSVSEGAGAIRIKVLNKTGKQGEVSVKSRDDTATGGEDYEVFDQVIAFKKDEKEQEIKIKIFDDDEWEPDEDFYVDLHDAQSGDKLIGGDTSTRVTIIDDDKPGMIVFHEKRAIRQDANEKTCRIRVDRVQGSDGKISVKYKTIELDKSENTAIPGKDYEFVEGTLEFAHGEVEKEICVPII